MPRTTRTRSPRPGCHSSSTASPRRPKRRRPPTWDHALPFLAQKVIDLGYDLPNPYGVQLLYVHMDQELKLDDLEVGFNGGDRYPINFVFFPAARAVNDTEQVRLDAWIFPFLDAYAFVGRIDGEAPLDFSISGDQLLENAASTARTPASATG